ncbi:MAG: hypothetical protein ACREQV_21735 [Candidatus Binatia bacterium]
MRIESVTVVILACAAEVMAAQGGPLPVIAEQRDTASEQLQVGRALAREARQAKDPEKRLRALEMAVAHLEVIPRRWPDDARAIVAAGLQKADLYRLVARMSDVVEVLESIQTKAAEFPEGIFAFRALAKVYAEVGDARGAREAFERATNEAQLSGLAPGMQVQTLKEAARYHLGTGEPALAAKYYERIASVPSIRRWVAFHNLAQAVKGWIAARDEAAASRAFDRLQHLFDEINSEPISEEGDAFQREVFAQEIEILREKLREL